MAMYALDYYTIAQLRKLPTAHKATWGAEDYDLIDRIYVSGMHVHRTVPDRYVHYYHSRNRAHSWYGGKQ